MTTHSNGQADWDYLAGLCLNYAQARAELEHASEAVRAEQRATAIRMLGEIQRCSAALTKASDALRISVTKAVRQGLFTKRRTRVVEGVRIGVKKGADSVEVRDEAACIALIRKHLTGRDNHWNEKLR